MSWLLSEFLLHEVVLSNDLSQSGIRRFRRDMRLGMMPVLGQFRRQGPFGGGLSSSSSLPSSRLSEAVDLLSLPAGTAMLLLEALEDEAVTSVDDAKEILKENGVFQLSGSLAKTVLRRRTDLSAMRRNIM